MVTNCRLASVATLALATTAGALSLAGAPPTLRSLPAMTATIGVPITRRSHLPVMTATTRNIFADEITATNLCLHVRPRAFRTARTGYAYQPHACCTHQWRRRRAAWHRGGTTGRTHRVLCDIPQASNPLHVLIAGAGVGGLALANQLQLSDAHVTYTVLEKTNEFRKFGGPIQLASNAMESLKNLDAELYGEIEARVIARHPSSSPSPSAASASPSPSPSSSPRP